MSELHYFREVVRLQEEVIELRLRLEKEIRDATYGVFPEELAHEFQEKTELFCQAVDLAYPKGTPRAPTPDELEMLAFAEKLAARQGTIAPDFKSLYRRKAEFDDRR